MRENKYRTLKGQVINLENLSSKEYDLFIKTLSYFKRKPDKNKFAIYWLTKIDFVYKGKTKAFMGESPLFIICQDLEARLGTIQKETGLEDYRDQLAELIHKQFKSRYNFCKKFHIDQSYLSNVLSKKRNFSMNKLEEILNKAGYEIEIKQKEKQ